MKSGLVTFVCASVVVASAAIATPAAAQVRPMHSGHMSHGAPQMRADGSGLHRPNRPSYHHHKGYAGYRPVYPAYREAEVSTGTIVE